MTTSSSENFDLTPRRQIDNPSLGGPVHAGQRPVPQRRNPPAPPPPNARLANTEGSAKPPVLSSTSFQSLRQDLERQDLERQDSKTKDAEWRNGAQPAHDPLARQHRVNHRDQSPSKGLWPLQPGILKAIAWGILPVLALGGGAYILGNRAVAQGHGTVQQNQAIQWMEQLNRYMGERYQDIQAIAEQPALTDPDMRAAATGDEKVLLLEQMKQSYGVYSRLVLLNLDGQVSVQTAGPRVAAIGQLAEFQQVVAKKQPVFIAPSEAEPEMRLLAPVIDRTSGKLIAVVIAYLPLQSLATLLQSQQVPSEFLIYNDQGKVLLASQKAYLNRTIQELYPELPQLQQPSPKSPIISPELLNGVVLLKRLVGMPAKAHVLGVTHTASQSGLPAINWTVVAQGNPASVVQSQIKHTVWGSLGTLASMGLVAGIALLSARRASRLVQDEVQTLTQQMGQLEAKRHRVYQRSQLLSEIVDHMRRSLREEDILSTIVSELRYALATDRVIVYRFHDDWNGTIIAEAVGANWKKILGQTVQDPFREGLIDRYRNGRVRTMNDIFAEGLTKCHRDILENFQVRASIVAPIIQNDRLVGLLCAHQCSSARVWEEEDVDLFGKLAAQLGYVLDQATLLRQQTLSVERSRLLNEIVTSMRRSTSETEILNLMVTELRYALNTDRVIIYRFSDDWNGTIIAESVASGWHTILGETVYDQFREGLIERYQNGRVRAMNDIRTENLTSCHLDILEGFQIRASIVAPIVQNKKLVGLLCAHQCSGPRLWEPQDIDLFAKLAIQLGFALDQAALFHQQARSAERSRMLNEVVASMRRSLKQEEILNITVSELRYSLDTDRVIVYRFHNDWNGTIIAESVASGWRKILGETVQDPFREGLIERYKNGRVRAMNDIHAEGLTDCHRDILEGFQIRASIVAPIIQNKQLVGLLCAHQCRGPRQWEAEDVEVFIHLSMQLGFALDQAELLEYTEKARQEARSEADAKTEEQRQQKEFLQRRALELLADVKPVNTGDLTVQARVSSDEIGTIADSYNTIITSLRQIVEQVQQASESVVDTASGNETAVSSLSVEAKLQMQALQSALDQIKALEMSSHGVQERAKRAESSVRLATDALHAGDEAMDRTVAGISEIRETVAETAKKVKRLGEASQKISRVVNLINGFAAQTNLLSLNAAVEAARAGDQGQGFGIVAEEVRMLAQQSAAATEEIESLVLEIQRQTNDVVAAMEAGTEQVVVGTQLVEESRQHMSQISSVSGTINHLVREIAQASAQQTETSMAVSEKMHQVANIAEETSHQSESVASSFSQLVQVAQNLRVNVAKFKVR